MQFPQCGTRYIISNGFKPKGPPKEYDAVYDN